MDEKLVRLVAHLFSPEEAQVAVHVPYYYPGSISRIARKARRKAETVKPVLDRLAERRVIIGVNSRYALMPLIPGMFEYMLMDGRDSAWHRKYAELLMDVWTTGYVEQYNTSAIPAVRNIPVQSTVKDHKSIVVDHDLISELIDHHQEMAVLNVCQCRQSIHFTGRECARADTKDGCLIFGSFARNTEKSGDGRNVSKEEMRDIVTQRWEKKLVFLTGNVAIDSPNAICTCCDCCCHFLEGVNHWNGKALLAPAHFLAQVDQQLCNNCGKCTRACNTGAHVMENKEHGYDRDKCIGCGVCVPACKEEAITMQENPEWKKPSKSFPTLGLKLFPVTALQGLKVKMGR